ncbi:MAG: hypothetical protein HRT92_03775 [Piscirickettsiaceae bacterium]|nr:hypothetical protein [Piscirickettsiaceae bacterium]
MIEIIEHMYQNRHILATAYDERGTTLSDDEMTRILPLVKNYMVRKQGGNKIRLDRNFRKLFDLPLLRHKFVAIDTNLHSVVDEIEHLVLELSDIKPEHVDVRMDKVEEINELIGDIYNMLENAIDQLHIKIETNFGLLSMSKSKQAENERYISDISKLLTSYGEVEDILSGGVRRDAPEIRDAVTNLQVRCISAIDKIKFIDKRLREFMFKQREIEFKARQVKALIRHVQKTPNFNPERSEKAFESHIQGRAIKPFSVALYPDVQDKQSEELFAAMVIDIQSKLRIRYENEIKRKESIITHRQNKKEEEMPSPLYNAITAMLVSVHQTGKPEKLTNYWQVNINQKINKERFSFDEFAYETLLYLDHDPSFGRKRASDYIARHLVLKDVPLFTGNKLLEDVYIYPAVLSPIHVIRTLS